MWLTVTAGTGTSPWKGVEVGIEMWDLQKSCRQSVKDEKKEKRKVNATYCLLLVLMCYCVMKGGTGKWGLYIEPVSKERKCNSPLNPRSGKLRSGEVACGVLGGESERTRKETKCLCN